MSGRNEITYPNRGRVQLDGGLNNKYERSIIKDNESPDCQDVLFINGAVETRQGNTLLNTQAVGTFVVDGIYTRRTAAGVESMVVFAGGTGWVLSGTTFQTIASAQSVFTAGIRVAATQYEEHMFIGNGGVDPYKYNGTNFTRHGVPAPASAVTAVASATGGTFPSATFRYAYTYVNSQSVEGDISPVTNVAVGANGSVELSGIGVAPTSHGVGSRRLYRASGASSVTYERFATIADNTTTTFSDTYYPAGTAAPTDNGEPPKYSVCVYHQNRLFVNDVDNPNFVWYSELFEPYTFASTNFFRVGDATSDIVKGLDVYENSIVVLCEKSIHLNIMPTVDDADWGQVRIKSEFGTKSPFGTFFWNNKLMFPAMQNDKFSGFASISGSTIDPEATSLETQRAGSDLKSDRIEPDMFDVQEAYVGNISSMVYKNKAYITVTKTTNSTTNNRVYVFDYSRSNLSKDQEASWSPLDNINAAQFTVYGGSLYYGSSTATGFVYRMENTLYSDTGTAIDSYFWTKEFSGLKGHENLQKDFRKAKLLVELSGNYYMTLNYRVDSDSGDGTSVQVDLSPDAETWNEFNWGAANWGTAGLQKEITVPLGQSNGKRIQFRFSNQNTAGQKFKVHGLNFTYNIKGRR